MKVGKYNVSFEKSWQIRRIGLYVMELRIDDPMGSLNYASVHYKRGKFWNSVGHKPSITHHHTLRGEFETPRQAIDALMCELRMRSYAKGTREYAEAYRDRWLPDIEILDELPEGWRVTDGMTQPVGTKWCCNSKSLFGGEYEHSLLYVGR